MKSKRIEEDAIGHIDKMFNIEEELKKLPQTPGVYMHKDSLGNVIYVGKAIKLKNRVSQYFHKSSQHSPKVVAMVENIAEFDYITCATEMEALILECNLIKKYMPKYNILLKDGKTYPYIEVTTSDEFPRVIRTREVKRDGNKYFGPYSDSGAVSRIIKLINEIYPIKKCKTKDFPENVRPCLNYYIGQCKGICIGAADKNEYDEMIENIIEILSGKDAELIKELKSKMFEASSKLEYEEAAKYRDYIESFKVLGETQRATMTSDRDIDVLLPLSTFNQNIIAQYKVRDGKLVGREIHYMDDILDELESTNKNEMLTAFIKQYYSGTSKLPKEIILDRNIEDEGLIKQLLDNINKQNAEAKSDTAHKTRLLIPERGEKKAVLELALTDSLQLVKSLDERAEREKERKSNLKFELTKIIERVAEISDAIPYTLDENDEREYRVEAYDISNMNGLDTVGAMVVYEGAKPIKKDYRKFKIKSDDAEGDDYASLQEVIYRRLKRAKSGDSGFSKYPDIMFIDGGLGQVHAVKKVIDAFRMSIPVVGLAKDDAHRTRAIIFEDGTEIELKKSPMLFSYCGRIQEEVHRFAITFQRGRRSNKMTKSALEEIPGIGPTRRRELLAKFKSIEAIKNAAYEELMECSSINSKAAENIIEYFTGK